MESSNGLVKLNTSINELSAEELEKMAIEKATTILQKIEESNERIRISKSNADDARSMKTGFFGRTGKKVNALSSALVSTNEAIVEMNSLISEAINFTCSSIQFATVMNKTMARLVVEGFKDKDGKIQRLSKDSEEAVNLIIGEAEDFVTRQLAYEQNQAAVNSKISSLVLTLAEKEKIDKQQDERLLKLQEVLDSKASVDEKQEESINILLQYMKQKEVLDNSQTMEIDILKKASRGWKIQLGVGVAVSCFNIAALILFVFIL